MVLLLLLVLDLQQLQVISSHLNCMVNVVVLLLHCQYLFLLLISQLAKGLIVLLLESPLLIFNGLFLIKYLLLRLSLLLPLTLFKS